MSQISGILAGVMRIPQFPLPILILLTTLYLSVLRNWCKRPKKGRAPSGLSLIPTSCRKPTNDSEKHVAFIFMVNN
jgi:hypothetical protein